MHVSERGSSQETLVDLPLSAGHAVLLQSWPILHIHVERLGGPVRVITSHPKHEIIPAL